MEHSLNLNETNLPLCGCGVMAENWIPPSVGYRKYVLILNTILLPVLTFFGIIGNVLNVIVYSRPSMRCSLNVYLALLAVSDFFVTWTAVFMFTFESLRWTNPGIRRVYLAGIPYIFPLAMIAQTCSVYFTVAAGVDCFIAVVRPLKKDVYCTQKRAIIVGAIVLVLALIYNVTRWYEIEIINCYDDHVNSTAVDVCPSTLRQNKLYNEIYYLNMYTVVMSIGPMIVLFVLNITVVKVTVTKRRNRFWIRTVNNSLAVDLVPDYSSIRRNNNDPRECDPNINNNNSADTVSLICVVCLFLLCNVLSLIINFVETFSDVSTLVDYLVDLSNLLVVLNSSVNFFIYLHFGNNFRKTLKKLFSPLEFSRPHQKDVGETAYAEYN